MKPVIIFAGTSVVSLISIIISQHKRIKKLKLELKDLSIFADLNARIVEEHYNNSSDDMLISEELSNDLEFYILMKNNQL